ncbi:metal-sulfur cluster assembly factor [Halorientalis halophila]|uniref:metal-sulfur cluster assembly factor n=1 Tax=Halorientalis halophila TaxID=3108499 RepID=UPI00300B7070
MTSEARVREALREVVDPCTAANGSDLDVVEMGLIADLTVEDGAVRVDLRLTTPACHMVPYFITEITDRVEPLDGVESVTVETDAGMDWTPEMMTDAARAKRRAVLDRYDEKYEAARATD